MAWTVPLTAVANTVLSAGQWNASVRDNLLETTPGKATTRGRIFVTSGTNKIAARAVEQHIVSNIETTTSLTYVDLDTLGPTVTLETGPQAIVWLTGSLQNSSTFQTFASYEISGAAAGDQEAMLVDGGAAANSPRCSVTNLQTIADPGINSFTMKYRVGTASTGLAWRRRILVMGL